MTDPIRADMADAQRSDLADAILGTLENGPWRLIADPALREIVREYVADACHAIALAAGLDAAAEVAHDACPVRLATTMPPPAEPEPRYFGVGWD